MSAEECAPIQPLPGWDSCVPAGGVDPDAPTGADCDDPIHVEICVGEDQEPIPVEIDWTEMPLGIEASLAPVGCIFDEDCNVVGKVFLCKKVDEETGVETVSMVHVATGSDTVDPYDIAIHGEWDDCASPACVEPCVPECTDAYIASFNGADDLSGISPFQSIVIAKPSCCELTVTIDAGTFVLPAGLTQYAPECFVCDQTSLQISASDPACLSDTTVLLQHIGNRKDCA